MKGRSIPYSADEMAWLEANRLLSIKDYQRAFCATFGRDVEAVNLHALRKRKGWFTGRSGCFERGHTPHNKGQNFNPPGSEKGRFKKGNRTGQANYNHKPVGTERVTDEGYLERKMHEGTPARSRWQLVHRMKWEAIHGPVPKGMCLKCLGADRLNTDPSNWALVPRAILPRLNGGRFKTKLAYDTAAPEVKPAILAIARLEHRSREIRQRSKAA